MLAKIAKMQNLRKQRDYIYSQLTYLIQNSEDGDITYHYLGQIFPENVRYFEEEGFKIVKVQTDLLTSLTLYPELNVFVIGDIELSMDELEQSLNGGSKIDDSKSKIIPLCWENEEDPYGDEWE